MEANKKENENTKEENSLERKINKNWNIKKEFSSKGLQEWKWEIR